MGGEDHAVVGMCLHDAARPGKLRVGRAVVKGDVKIVHLAHRKGGVGGLKLRLVIEAAEHGAIGIRAEGGVELGGGVVIAADEREGNCAVKLSDLIGGQNGRRGNPGVLAMPSLLVEIPQHFLPRLPR